jgi:hypothetical protein
MSGNPIHSEKFILPKEILNRRARIHQHELDLKLIAIQSKSLRTSNAITAICTIAGGIAGALLTAWLK